MPVPEPPYTGKFYVQSNKVYVNIRSFQLSNPNSSPDNMYPKCTKYKHNFYVWNTSLFVLQYYFQFFEIFSRLLHVLLVVVRISNIISYVKPYFLDHIKNWAHWFIVQVQYSISVSLLRLGGCAQQWAVGVRGSAASNGEQYSSRWTTWRDSTMFPTGLRPWSSGVDSPSVGCST